MVTIYDIRYLLGTHIDNDFYITDMDGLKDYLCYDLLRSHVTRLENTHLQDLNELQSMLICINELVSLTPSTSRFRVNVTILFTACIFFYIANKKIDIAMELVKQSRYILAENDLTPKDITEILHIIQFVNSQSLSNITLSVKTNLPIMNTGNIRLFHDAMILYPLKSIEEYLLQSYQSISDLHLSDKNYITSDRLWFLTYLSLTNSIPNIPLLFESVSRESSYYSYLTDIKYLLQNFDIFIEYVNTFINSISLNRY